MNEKICISVDTFKVWIICYLKNKIKELEKILKEKNKLEEDEKLEIVETSDNEAIVVLRIFKTDNKEGIPIKVLIGEFKVYKDKICYCIAKEYLEEIEKILE